MVYCARTGIISLGLHILVYIIVHRGYVHAYIHKEIDVQIDAFCIYLLRNCKFVWLYSPFCWPTEILLISLKNVFHFLNLQVLNLKEAHFILKMRVTFIFNILLNHNKKKWSHGLNCYFNSIHQNWVSFTWHSY